MSVESDLEQLASARIEGVENGDTAQLKKIFSSDFTLWHNTTNQNVSRADAFVVLAGLRQIPGLKYTDIRRCYWNGGFISQHVVTGGPSGAAFRLPVCVVATVREGRICRMEEWFDSAADPRNNTDRSHA